MARLLIKALGLEGRDPADIDASQPLFGQSGTGWGLDSIDALEIALAVQQKYGVEMRAEDESTHRAFASLAALADHVAEHAAAQAVVAEKAA